MKLLWKYLGNRLTDQFFTIMVCFIFLFCFSKRSCARFCCQFSVRFCSVIRNAVNARPLLLYIRTMLQRIVAASPVAFMTLPGSRIGRVGKHHMTFVVRSNLRNVLYKAIDYVDDVRGRLPGQCVTVCNL